MGDLETKVGFVAVALCAAGSVAGGLLQGYTHGMDESFRFTPVELGSFVAATGFIGGAALGLPDNELEPIKDGTTYAVISTVAYGVCYAIGYGASKVLTN